MCGGEGSRAKLCCLRCVMQLWLWEAHQTAVHPEDYRCHPLGQPPESQVHEDGGVWARDPDGRPRRTVRDPQPRQHRKLALPSPLPPRELLPRLSFMTRFVRASSVGGQGAL